MGLFGVGTDVAGQLLVTAGDNPQRLRSEAAFAMLCGVAPLPASSGRTHRHPAQPRRRPPGQRRALCSPRGRSRRRTVSLCSSCAARRSRRSGRKVAWEGGEWGWRPAAVGATGAAGECCTARRTHGVPRRGGAVR
jgi:hypothetical protein